MTRDDEIRAQLLNALKVIQPYARAQGRFHNVDDLSSAIKTALFYLGRAELLVSRIRRGPSSPPHPPKAG
jgi:hypothetical protein